MLNFLFVKLVLSINPAFKLDRDSRARVQITSAKSVLVVVKEMQIASASQFSSGSTAQLPLTEFAKLTVAFFCCFAREEEKTTGNVVSNNILIAVIIISFTVCT